jgi:hypothetical protein
MLATDLEHTKTLCREMELRQLYRFERKRLFWTKRSRFGFTPRGAKPSDSVCVFDGADIPHVLRKVNTSGKGKERWRFVGEAFVDGLMYGEADNIDIEGTEFCIVLIANLVEAKASRG